MMLAEKLIMVLRPCEGTRFSFRLFYLFGEEYEYWEEITFGRYQLDMDSGQAQLTSNSFIGFIDC